MSNALLFAPFYAVARAVKGRALGSLNPGPLALMLVSTVSWMGYALARKDFFILASNLPGAVVSTWYVTSVLPLTPSKQITAVVGIGCIGGSVQVILVGGATAVLVLWAWLVFSEKSEEEACAMLGLFASVVCK